MLTSDLVKQFVDATNDSVSTKDAKTTSYGTVVINDNGIFIKLDGSELLTPVSMSTDAQNGDRVLVNIEGHKANISGNFTSPASGRTATDLYASEVQEDGTVVVSGQLRVAKEYVDELIASDITANSIKTTNATITGRLDANEADIETLTADNATITGKLDANEADIETLTTKKADIDFANVKTLETVTAIVEDLLKAGHIIGNKVDAQTGSFTNYLTGVRIVGDIIDANTLKANTIILTGTDGLYYQLNANSLGVNAVQVDAEKYSTALDGSIIVEKSITAQKIVVDDLVAFGATIGGFSIGEHYLKSSNNKIVLNDDGSFHLGGTNGGISYNSNTDQLGIDASTVILGGNSVDKSLGTTVSSTEILYALSDSRISFNMVSGESWNRVMPLRSNGTYIWQKTVEYYMNGTDNSLTSVPVCIQGADGSNGEDAVLLRIDSSRGTVFKNNSISTVLNAVIYKGSERITDITKMHQIFGIGSYLQWSWQKIDDNSFGIISSTDKMIGNNGFTLTISADEVDTKVTFMCELIN